MTRGYKIIYWISTAWLALGMVSTGLVQLLRVEQEVEKITQLGYSGYILVMLGICKILGVIAVLIPGIPLLKEWAYAGFVFAMSGAVFSHIAVGDDVKQLFGPALLLILTGVSWYFRPESRRLIPLSDRTMNL